MARTADEAEEAPRGGAWRRWLRRLVLAAVLLPLAAIALYRVVPPPGSPYMWAEAWRLGGVERAWVPMERIAPAMARAAVAAEDADFCRHSGFDISALRAAARGGARRGGSTISQQVVKNAFLWQGRSWTRKAIEAVLTPVVELAWPKRRILEVYLNLAEFGEGVFGVEAAARDRFGVPGRRPHGGAGGAAGRRAALAQDAGRGRPAARAPAPRRADHGRGGDDQGRRARGLLRRLMARARAS